MVPIFIVQQAYWHNTMGTGLQPRKDAWGQGTSPDMLLLISKQ